MSGICKISDFGISKRTDDDSAHTALQGTVFWMAPEVINTQKKGYNLKIDIWSVGCVVLEMWAGNRPWIGDEAVAVMFKVCLIPHAGVLTTNCLSSSYTNPSSHRQCQMISSYLTLRRTSGGNVLLCMFPPSQCNAVYSYTSATETRRSVLQQLSSGSIDISHSNRVGCLTVSCRNMILTVVQYPPCVLLRYGSWFSSRSFHHSPTHPLATVLTCCSYYHIFHKLSISPSIAIR